MLKKQLITIHMKSTDNNTNKVLILHDILINPEMNKTFRQVNSQHIRKGG